jgi:hypothetical protein
MPNALQLRYLLSKGCAETTPSSCGHYDCECAGEQEAKSGSGNLGHFVALMTTCKFAYENHALIPQSRKSPR